MKQRKAIAIFGPTASGKSALAINLALEQNGIIVNSDSLQIYKELKILTACPDDEDIQKVPHFLYNTLNGKENCSAVKYINLLQELLLSQEKLPIIVGGTGLYLKAMIEGLVEIPETPETIRTLARNLPFKEIHSFVKENDTEFALEDEQRLRRAFEVIKTTGKPYSYWQTQPKKKLIDLDIELIKLAPDREELYHRCNIRFDMMIKAGAIEEVQNLLSMNYPPETTIMKAIGVTEIQKYLNNQISYDEMVRLSTTRTRQYAKRQITWMKTQI